MHGRLTTGDISGKLKGVESLVGEVFANFTMDDALAEQKNNLPASTDSLKPKGEALGSGAFGEVFELENDGDKKLVGKSFPAANADARKEMEHEAEIYARLGEHPNIAKCYGIHEVEGQSMLVMEKIEGKDIKKVLDDLSKRFRKKKITREEYLAATQQIFKGTLMGLAHMESMGLVHKDIKGDNIKFDPKTNQAVLIDMGLAQAEGAHENSKAFYPIAPPEQFLKKPGDKVVTSFWDSFSVGKMLFQEMERDAHGKQYQLITGGVPAEGTSLLNGKLVIQGARNAAQRTDTGEFKARTSADQLIGQALKPATDSFDAANPGKFGAATQYVDFLNRLTHPDPTQRMTASEALKHPFMSDALLAGEDLDRVFNKPKKDDPEAELPDVEAVPPNAAQNANKYAELSEDMLGSAQPYAVKQFSPEDLDDFSEEDSELESEDSDVEDSEVGTTSQKMKQVGENYWEQQTEDEAREKGDSDELKAEESDMSLRANKPTAYDLHVSEDVEQEEEQVEDAFGPEGDSSADESEEEELLDRRHNPNAYTFQVDEDDSLEESEEESDDEVSLARSAKKETADTPYVFSVDDEDESLETESAEESRPPKDAKTSSKPAPAKAQSPKDVEAALKKNTTALQRWQIAAQQVEQQFNSAYSNLAADKKALKAAGFTKGKKFSDYFTYNKDLDKLVKSLETAKAKSSKDVPKLTSKVLAATAHYREKILRKADTDFGWANADPKVTPPFWKTMIAALDDVDEWVNS